MVTKNLPSHTRRVFRWRLLMAVVGLIAVDHFLAPAHAADTAAPTVAQAAPSGVTGPLR